MYVSPANVSGKGSHHTGSFSLGHITGRMVVDSVVSGDITVVVGSEWRQACIVNNALLLLSTEGCLELVWFICKTYICESRNKNQMVSFVLHAHTHIHTH